MHQRETGRASQKKGAGPAGGESGTRAYGPALGGEAGAVLIGSLSEKGPRVDHRCRIDHLRRNTTRALMRLQPIELQHMPLGLRRVSAEVATIW